MQNGEGLHRPGVGTGCPLGTHLQEELRGEKVLLDWKRHKGFPGETDLRLGLEGCAERGQAF